MCLTAKARKLPKVLKSAPGIFLGVSKDQRLGIFNYDLGGKYELE